MTKISLMPRTWQKLKSGLTTSAMIRKAKHMNRVKPVKIEPVDEWESPLKKWFGKLIKY